MGDPKSLEGVHDSKPWALSALSSPASAGHSSEAT
jgi:hypothetical protein